MWRDAERGVDCGSYTSVNNDLSTHGISIMDEFCVNCEGGSSGEKREMNDLEPEMSLCCLQNS
jgi:hypothetical protein